MSRAPALVEANIRQKQLEVASLPPIPAIGPLQEKVNYWTTQATLDASRKGDLLIASNALADAIKLASDKSKLETEVAQLQDELVIAKQDEARAVKGQQLEQLQAARNELHVHAKSAAFAYRKCIRLARAAGVNTDNLPKFDYSNLRPVSWQGTLSEMMLQGEMPWENDAPTVAQQLRARA